MKDYRLSEAKKICNAHYTGHYTQCEICPLRTGICIHLDVAPAYLNIDEEDGEMQESSEGSVVLTKDEYEDIQARMAYLQEELGKLLRGDNISVSAREYGQLLYANENARKEMREIISKIGELSANKEIVELYMELCEKYGADVE